jgi:hypothetical protein
LAWRGLARLGLARLGSAWWGVVRYGEAWHGSVFCRGKEKNEMMIVLHIKLPPEDVAVLDAEAARVERVVPGLRRLGRAEMVRMLIRRMRPGDMVNVLRENRDNLHKKIRG